ncbi:hypothetical protein B0H14DRAFT_3557312, partial [Mycena olivaceomarginata]
FHLISTPSFFFQWPPTRPPKNLASKSTSATHPIHFSLALTSPSSSIPPSFPLCMFQLSSVPYRKTIDPTANMDGVIDVWVPFLPSQHGCWGTARIPDCSSRSTTPANGIRFMDSESRIIDHPSIKPTTEVIVLCETTLILMNWPETVTFFNKLPEPHVANETTVNIWGGFWILATGERKSTTPKAGPVRVLYTLSLQASTPSAGFHWLEAFDLGVMMRTPATANMTGNASRCIHLRISCLVATRFARLMPLSICRATYMSTRQGASWICPTNSSISSYARPNRAEIASELTDQIGLVLDYFLMKYAKELGLSHPGDYWRTKKIWKPNSQRCLLLSRPAAIVSLLRSIITMPPLGRSLALLVDAASIYQDVPTPREIEQLLDSCFWRPLMAATDVVHKISTPIAALSLQSACGFTEDEALHFRSRTFPGALTLNDLIELLATGAVNIGGKTASPFDIYAAKADTFRVTNGETLSLIHSRVDTVFAERHDLRWTFLDAWRNFSVDDAQPFLKILLEVLRDQSRRCFGREREPNLPGIFELVMRNARCAGRDVEPIILLERDRIRVPGFYPKKVFTLDLKTLTLRGMWLAAHPNDDEPTVEALKALHEELVNLPEDDLLARRVHRMVADIQRDGDRARRKLLALGAARKPPIYGGGGRSHFAASAAERKTTIILNNLFIYLRGTPHFFTFTLLRTWT